jgi:hypothetical protein
MCVLQSDPGWMYSALCPPLLTQQLALNVANVPMTVCGLRVVTLASPVRVTRVILDVDGRFLRVGFSDPVLRVADLSLFTVSPSVLQLVMLSWNGLTVLTPGGPSVAWEVLLHFQVAAFSFDPVRCSVRLLVTGSHGMQAVLCCFRFCVCRCKSVGCRYHCNGSHMRLSCLPQVPTPCSPSGEHHRRL